MLYPLNTADISVAIAVVDTTTAIYTDNTAIRAALNNHRSIPALTRKSSASRSG